ALRRRWWPRSNFKFRISDLRCRNRPISNCQGSSILLFLSTNIELQLPTPGAALLQPAEFQSPAFGHRCLQIHRNKLAGLPGLPTQGRFNGHDFFEFFVADHVVDHVAGSVFAANGGGEKSEHGGFAYDECKLLRRNIRLGSLLHSEWRHAQCFHGRFEPGDRRHGRLNADVIRPGRAAADPNAMTTTDPAVVRRAARDCQIEIGAFELLRRRSGIFRQPLIQYFSDTFLQSTCFEDAAIEQNRRRVNERLPFRDSRLPREKRGQVPCNAGVLRVRQADLRETRPSGGSWEVSDVDFRHKPVDENTSYILACQLHLDGAAY